MNLKKEADVREVRPGSYYDGMDDQYYFVYEEIAVRSGMEDATPEERDEGEIVVCQPTMDMRTLRCLPKRLFFSWITPFPLCNPLNHYYNRLRFMHELPPKVPFTGATRDGVRPGIHEHFKKRGTYAVYGVGELILDDEEKNKKLVVVYRPLYGASRLTWRPLEEFLSKATDAEGKKVDRFTYVRELT